MREKLEKEMREMTNEKLEKELKDQNKELKYLTNN